MRLSHGIFGAVQAVEDQFAKVREPNLPGHRIAELALVIDEVDDIQLTPGEIDVFTDLDIPVRTK